MVLIYPIERASIRLRALLRPTRLFATTVPPASRVPPPPQGHQIGARKWHTYLVNTILNQPNLRRVSTDRMNCEDSQLVASLEGEPSPTTAGKTDPPKPGFGGRGPETARRPTYFGGHSLQHLHFGDPSLKLKCFGVSHYNRYVFENLD